MLRRLARAIVVTYPSPWCERYEDEVLALIDDSPVRVRDLGELVRGLLVERARALIEDADHPTRTAAILSSLHPLFVISFIATAWGLGAALRVWRGPLPSGLADLGPIGIISFFVAFFFFKFVLWRRQRKAAGFSGTVFPAWAGLALLPLFFAGIVWSSWGNWEGVSVAFVPWWYRMLHWAFIFGMLASELTVSFWPGRRILEAIGRLSGADNQIKSARTWVDGCHTMIAKGIPSPLDQAQAQLDKLTRDRDQAHEELQRLGYRARFQP